MVLDGELERPSELLIFGSKLVGSGFAGLRCRIFFCDSVLRLERLVRLLHEVQTCVIELASPFLDEAVATLFYCCVSVAVEADPGQGLSEGPAGKLLMRCETAVLCDSIGEGKGVQLNVGIAMDETLLDGTDAVASSVTAKRRRKCGSDISPKSRMSNIVRRNVLTLTLRLMTPYRIPRG